MKHVYSLAHLTALGLPPPQLIQAAADAEYAYVGLRLNRVTPEEALYDVANDPELRRETKARLADTGVKVWDIELARMDPAHDHHHYLELLETAADLGARHVIAQLPDDDLERATERFAGLCDLAKPLGLRVDLEFVSWTQMSNLQGAAQVMRAVDRSNAGILIDTLHFDRSNSSIDELRQLPREWFTWAQVCDAPGEHPTTVEGLIFHGRCERMFPGDGGIDVKAILSALPDDIVYALEIPSNSSSARLGYPEYARQALRAAERFLDE